MNVRFPHWFRLWCIAIITFGFIVGCSGTSSQTARLESSQVSPAECRTIQHARGETCVPLNPQRVIVLHRAMLANAIALGVQPVGSTSIYISSGTKFPPYLEDKVDEKLEPIGTGEQPNLEKIARLKPDLIVGFTYNATYDQLSHIAPTVLIDWNMAGDWKEHLEFVAQTLGKTAEAKQLLEDYNRRIEQFKTAIGDRLAQFQVSLVNGGGNAAFLRSDVKDSFAGTILSDAGLQRPPAQNVKGLDIEISLETIPQLDGDAIFIMLVSDDKGDQVWERLQRQPLWSQLKAVKQDRVYLVDFSTWRGVNILAAYGVIDDLFKYLVEK